MIRVTVDFIPYDQAEDHKESLHFIEIKNIGGSEHYPNYIVTIKEKTYLIEKFEKKLGELVLIKTALEKILATSNK